MKNPELQLITLKEAGQILKVHPNTLRLWEKDGLITPIRLSGKRFRRYYLKDIYNLLESMGKESAGLSQIDILNLPPKTEERFGITMDYLLEGCQIIGFDWRYIYINNAAEKHNRRPKEELIGKKYTDMWPGIESTHVFKLIKNCLEKRKPHNLENYFVFPDGSTGWFDLRIEPVPEGVFILSLDITNNKTAEKKLRESELHYKTLTENAPDIIMRFDRNLHITYLSPNAESIIGMKTESVIGKTNEEIGMPDHLCRMWNRMFQKASHTKKTQQIEFDFSSKNGTLNTFDLRIVPECDNKGTVVSFIGISRNITTRKITEQALQLSEEKFAKAFASNAAAIAVTTLDEGIFIDVNETWETLMGYKKSEVMGKSARALSIWPTREAAQRFVKVLKKKKLIRGWEQEFRKKNGESFIAQLSTQMLKLQGKQVILSTLIDITERKQMEKRKDEFISIASHELKTPITSLKAYTQIIGQRLEKARDVSNTDLVKRMEFQINRLTGLVSDMLDVTKIQSGKLLLPKEFFDLNDLVKDTVTDIRNIARDGNKFSFTLKGEIKQNVYADKFRISQVLTNLLTNAIKYSPHSNKIIISLSSSNTDAKVAIRDFGIGIPKNEQAHIFERYFQAHAARNQEGRFSSLGLGLYISAEIIKRHGGKIWCISKQGKGSTFSFTLPMHKQ